MADGSTEIGVRLLDAPEVKMALDAAREELKQARAERDELRELAEAIDRAARSLFTSLPYQPPEALRDLIREKLVGPLHDLHYSLHPEDTG